MWFLGSEKFRRKNILKRHHKHSCSFPCPFNVGVLCSLLKSEKFLIFAECFGCRHYIAFCKRMDKEEEEVFRKVERKSHG